PIKRDTSWGKRTSRRSCIVITSAKAAAQRVISGTTVASGTKKGSSEREMSPLPKPVRPQTKLATANIHAPTTHVKLTRGPLRMCSYLHCTRAGELKRGIVSLTRGNWTRVDGATPSPWKRCLHLAL